MTRRDALAESAELADVLALLKTPRRVSVVADSRRTLRGWSVLVAGRCLRSRAEVNRFIVGIFSAPDTLHAPAVTSSASPAL